MSDSASVEAPEQQITITRVFDAPRELVFKAWTDPDHVSKWLGPDGFDTPRETIAIDLRAGGRFHVRMVRRGSGAEYWIRYEILELVEPELLVLKSEPMPEAGLHNPTIARVELEEDGGKTRMTLTDGPYPAAAGNGAAAGWEAAFDKMAALLAGSD
jgi:uncharacterized protein YndB with AHSA1/START domain